MRPAGAGQWGRSSVAQLEAGEKRLTGEELLVLPYVISEATRHDEELSLLDLVTPTQGRVEITAEFQPRRAGLEAIFAGLTGIDAAQESSRQPPSSNRSTTS